MKKRFWSLIGFLLAFGCMLLCACQPAPTPTPTRPADTATDVPAPTTTPVPATPTLAPTATKTGGVTFNVKWEFQTGGPVWGNATVSDGIVYFGSDDQNLYALDAKSKDLKWKFATQGIIRSQPALDQGLVFIASDDGFVYAVKAADGSLAWRTDIGNLLPRDKREALGNSPVPTGYDYVQSSPVAAGGLVFVGSMDGRIYALAADTGAVTWRYQTGEKVRSTPTVAGDVVYVGSWDKNLYALSAKTGALIWKTPVGGQIQSKAAVADGLVITASRKASVVALDQKTGEMKWEYGYGANSWVESSPYLFNGTIFIGASANKAVNGLNYQTGEQATVYLSEAWLWSTPTVVGDILYIGGTAAKGEGNNGGLYGIKLVDGKFTSLTAFQWFFPTGDTLEAEGSWSGVASSPVAVNGVLYFGGLDGKLYAVKPVVK